MMITLTIINTQEKFEIMDFLIDLDFLFIFDYLVQWSMD